MRLQVHFREQCFGGGLEIVDKGGNEAAVRAGIKACFPSLDVAWRGFKADAEAVPEPHEIEEID